MPTKRDRYATVTREVLIAVFAACGAYFLSDFSFRLFASSSVSDSFGEMDTMAGFLDPFATIALVSGLLSGLVLSVSERKHPVRIALWAGLLMCVLQLVIAVAVGGLAWAASNYALLGAPCLAVGLLLGALLGRKIWHA
jgi:hypothetical protein